MAIVVYIYNNGIYLLINYFLRPVINIVVNAFFFLFFIRNNNIVYIDKKCKRRMRDPPHKIQESDQNMT